MSPQFEKTRPTLVLIFAFLCIGAAGEITTTVDTAIKTDPAGRVPQISTTVKTINTATSRELKRITKVTDFNPGTSTMIKVTKTVENFDPRTGEKIRVTFVETKRDSKTGASIRTIAVANFDPATSQLVSKGSSVEYADQQGRFFSPEPAEDLASADEAPSGTPPAGRKSPHAAFSSPFQVNE